VYGLRGSTFASSWIDLPPLAAEPAEALPRVTIVVPARDEERSIEACVASLLAQRWVHFRVIVVDDRSTDATPRILERLAASDGRLQVVRGDELPDGWVGKPWALHQGVAHADGEWLLFTDADSIHHPLATATALWYASRTPVDVLSLATGQDLETFWERATLPSILGVLFFVTGPFGAINDPAKPNRALANGQYILARRSAYDALGGHAALRNEIVEDLEFARRIKADGRFRLALVAGETLVRVRMYRSLAEIWEGFTKNIFLGAKGNVPATAAFAALLLALSVAPPLLAVRALARRRPFEAAEAVATSLAIFAATRWGVGRTTIDPRLAVYQPLGFAVFAAISINSAWQSITGKGVMWRGRRYRGGKTGT